MNAMIRDTPQLRRCLKRLLPFLPFVGLGIVSIGIAAIPDLGMAGRWSLLIFCTTIFCWTFTSLNVSYVAIFSALTLVVTGATSQAELFKSLGDEIVWLMLGAFILGAAIQKTGLSVRLTQVMMTRVKTVGGLFWMMTAFIIPLSFLIPSTSGRAAVTFPIFKSVTTEMQDPKITRALSLLIPSVILVSTIVSLVGAGSHLIANELLLQMNQQHISFGQWALYGLPFGIVASALTCWVITTVFLDRSHLKRALKVSLNDLSIPASTLTRSEILTILISLGMVTLWLTEGMHGFKVATVAIIGGVLLAMPNLGVLSWKEALKSVSWNLIMFVSAALVLGRSLVQSGAAQWVIDHTVYMSGIANQGSHLVILFILTAIALTSHLYMTSHAARAVAIVPAFLSLATTLHLNPIAVVFIGTLGMDYCLTLPVSSKALLVYQDNEQPTYKPKDLLRLSFILLPIHLGLVILFYFTYWNWIGLRF
jgi:anion transporter